MAQQLPLTQKAAREVGSKRYFTGKPCKYGHIADRNTKNGTCYECSAIRGKAWFNANADKVKAQAKEWSRNNQDRKKATDKAYRETNYETLRSRKFEYYHENAEAIKEKSRLWKRDNPARVTQHNTNRRAIKLSAEGSYTDDDVEVLRAKQGNRCAICSKKLSKTYHVDHVTPLSRGGTNWPTNLQITCPKCNLQKGAKDPYDFMRERGLLL